MGRNAWDHKWTRHANKSPANRRPQEEPCRLCYGSGMIGHLALQLCPACKGSGVKP